MFVQFHAFISKFLANNVEQSEFPARSKSHPLPDPRKSFHRDRKAEAFDPDELCRRLAALRQDLRESHRRHRERAEQRTKPVIYHHTPQVAARDFASTTTPHTLREKDVHKLSRSVLKKYKLGPGLGPEYKASSFEDPQQHPGNTSQTIDLLAERNQFQRTPALELAARTDRARNGNQRSLQDLQTSVISSNAHVDVPQAGRFTETNAENLSNVKSAVFTPHPDDRNDWTQRDECRKNDKHVLKYLTGSVFRRMVKIDTSRHSDKITCNVSTDLITKDSQNNHVLHHRFT